ncbi:hypothetical protein [Tsukamurella soli]|uniref:Secreted protein n=1 Tax=Tsukamurella soli TaxID=644556 RepID=A0ABP8J7H0_9ACTN
MTGAVAFGALFALGCLTVAAMLGDAGQTRTARGFGRYDVFDRFADLGCGAEEYGRTRRFSRPTDTRKAPDSPAKKPSEATDPTNPQQETKP